MVERVVRRLVFIMGGVSEIPISGCGCSGRESVDTVGTCVSGVGASGFFASAGGPTFGLPAAAAPTV